MSRLASPNFLDLKTNKVERAPFEKKFYQKLFELSLTSQDQSNSAPYQRLENSKRTLCAGDPLACPGALKGGTLSHCLTSIVAKHQKI